MTTYKNITISTLHDASAIDVLTVNGVRFVRAGEDVSVLSGWFIQTLVLVVVASNIVTALVVGGMAWLVWGRGMWP